MSHSFTIQEGAFFISDAHYSHLRPQLLSFMREIYVGGLAPTQLIFMGDVFDALFGAIPYTYSENKEVIELINDISKTIEIIYLEGNHDFNLKRIFPHVKVYSIKQQPIKAKFANKKVLLAHGDFDGGFGYKLYTTLIRSKVILHFLRFIDSVTKHFILKKIDAYLGKKDDCKKFSGFKEFIINRLSQKYRCSYFIEGHFHQNTSFEVDKFEYINLGAFACNQRYFIVKSSQDKELLQEKTFS
ncbi:UDP-2,3-diacylglucosamine diphosphatase [Sulfurimonas sp.]